MKEILAKVNIQNLQVYVIGKIYNFFMSNGTDIRGKVTSQDITSVEVEVIDEDEE